MTVLKTFSSDVRFTPDRSIETVSSSAARPTEPLDMSRILTSTGLHLSTLPGHNVVASVIGQTKSSIIESDSRSPKNERAASEVIPTQGEVKKRIRRKIEKRILRSVPADRDVSAVVSKKKIYINNY